MPKVLCAICGEESGAEGSSMYGSVHKYGPRGHAFRPVLCRKPENETPNLDAMTASELVAFSDARDAGGYGGLFPSGLSGQDKRRAALNLAYYARMKALAIYARERGHIPTALSHERECDRVYAGLPEWARW